MVRNPFYQLAELKRYARAIGWTAAVRLRLCDVRVRSGIGQPKLLKVNLKNARFPLYMRTHTSDRDVLQQVFIRGEYEPVELSNPKTIIDLGANVGYSAAYFLTKYPTATVLAVEPDPGNYFACCRNLEPFGTKAKIIHGAAWAERTTLLVERGTYRDGREWSTQVRHATETNLHGQDCVQAYDMNALIEMSEASEIDLLKIDIERSELELFSRNVEQWLPRVKNLSVELHDAECREVFFRAVSNYTYELNDSDAVTVCLNLRARGELSAQSRS